MPQFRLPLSGDVTQAINPWTWFLRAAGNQLGFINVNLGRSTDPELEERIVNEVGSYGRQLGQIGDALRVLIKHAPMEELAPEEKRALHRLECELDEIDRIKSRRERELGRRP
jgi:hypothetical protein